MKSYTGCPNRYRSRHFFNNFTTVEIVWLDGGTLLRVATIRRTTDTHYRHALQTRTTDTHYRHTIDTHYRHTLQTRTTDTHYRHALQTRTTDTHYRHTLQTHTTDTFLFISHTTNVLEFKFLCSIFIGVRTVKDMPGSVASGTSCIRSL